MTPNNFLQVLKKKFYLLEQIIFYLLILFLPTQFGKHFWPKFSYISGIRIDYLSPTIYLTDLLILFLLAISIINFLKRFKNILNLKCKFIIYYLLFTITVLFIGVFSSKNPMAAGYGVLKFLEFVFFGFYTAGKIKTIKEIEKIAVIFSLVVIFESGLAIFQFFNQSSLGGLFYFFGERAFNSQTPGIANASLAGQLILRPYATFPHPNVLAGYLTIAMAIAISNMKYQISNTKKIISSASLIIGSIALILTMSRVAVLVWLMIFLYIIISRKFTICYLLFAIVALVIFFFSPLRERFTNINFNDQSIVAREELIKSSFLMLKDHLFFGVGVNNFLVRLPSYQKLDTQSLFSYLQPVHNIYLLIASQTGVIGLSFFIWFIVKTYKRIRNQESLIHNSKFIILSLVLILGFFDHYFLTIQQGQLLFSFVLGFCWSRVKK